jgi:hypothetical protein
MYTYFTRIYWDAQRNFCNITELLVEEMTRTVLPSPVC